MGGRGSSGSSGSGGGGSSSSGGGGGGKGGSKPAGNPALTGSQKQIEWANKLRDSYMAVMNKTHPQSVAKTVASHTDAGYWINNRYGLGATNSQQREIQKLWYNK